VLFKLLFIISVILSTFSETEIALDAGHKLSLTQVNLITLDDVLNPQLDLDSPYTLNSIAVDLVLKGHEQPVLTYNAPFPSQLYFVNTHPRAPPAYIS